MATQLIHSGSSVTRDPDSNALRSWFDLGFVMESKDHEVPSDLARRVLIEHAAEFAWTEGLADIVDQGTLSAPGGASVRFLQTFKKVPVDASDIVVNVADGGHVHSIYNGYHYDIPADLAVEPRVDEQGAVAMVHRLAEAYKGVEVRLARLVVYRYQRVSNATGKPHRGSPARQRVLAIADLEHARAADQGEAPEPGRHYLAWDIRIASTQPRASLRYLIDAANGQLLNLIDLDQYASGTAKVFDPNPIVTSGDTAMRHNTAIGTVDAQRRDVTVEHLDAATGGNLHLTGAHVAMREEENPNIAAPASTTGTFSYSWTDNSFLDAMAYYHLDRFQNYIETTLGLNNVTNYSIPVDPQGLDGADNSHYSPGGSGKGYIAFGGGTQPIPNTNPVPDAADAMVVLHEYGHAIQDNSNPGFDNPASGIGEGWGDTLAAIYYDDKHANPAATRGYMMSWDSEMGTGSWQGRRYDMAWLFDGTEYANAVATDNHTSGQLWCATMFELYRKFGGDSQYAGTKSAGRDLALRLHMMANFMVPTNGGTAAQMGQQIEAADHALGGWRYANGLHRKVIDDTFRRRHLSGYPNPAVDVYINDGRQGGYGSISSNDAFTERLWLDTWWEVQDVWVKVAPYASAADQQAGDPGDHVEPPVGSTAYLYVRVKNRGTSTAGSGPITVKAFHADPGIGLVWPTDWVAMNTASHTVSNVLPGPAHAVVVGPFPWTPTVVGHECVLAIVECAADHALTQDLPAGTQVGDGDLVPFDNNIAQRNLAPTPAIGGGKRKFTVRNPFEVSKIVRLQLVDELPRDWTCRLPDDGRIELGPFERRWVEIDIVAGAPAELSVGPAPQVRITGLIDDVPIGGMTFYLAPPSAFPSGTGEHGHRPGHECHFERGACECGRVLPRPWGLEVPWQDCSFEGEISVRVRFRRDRD